MGALLALLGHHDERILHALILRRRDFVDRLMRTVTHLGDAWLTILVTVLSLAGVIPMLARHAGRMAFALVVSHLFVQLLKRTVTRTRPRMPSGYAALIEPPDRFSFPSGHAAASLSLALPLVIVLPGILGTMVALLAVVVGVSRCYLGVHYPGDVLMGWLLAGSAFYIAGPLLS